MKRINNACLEKYFRVMLSIEFVVYTVFHNPWLRDEDNQHIMNSKHSIFWRTIVICTKLNTLLYSYAHHHLLVSAFDD